MDGFGSVNDKDSYLVGCCF